MEELSFSSNGDVFSLKYCWNGPIRLRSNRHWLAFASTEGNRYELYAYISKNCGHFLSSRFYGLRLLRNWFTRWNPLFWLFLRLGYEVMNPCFVYSNELRMQKFIWITLKHPNIVLKSSHGRAYGPQWANAAPISTIAFSYPIIRAKLKSPCTMWYASTSSRTFTRRSVKTISCILSMISGVAALIGPVPNKVHHMWMYDHV